ncbi:MAG: hypothetical protein IT514_10390 [Burkholderiales bacterium]|nr:hypothetical protein [Burkholderiales bacterium]
MTAASNARARGAPLRPGWREWLLAVLAAATLAAAFAFGPVSQDPGYHGFADRRAFLGIPNAGDVLSNLAFLIAGGAGLAWLRGGEPGGERSAWTVLFCSVALVAAGSAWYHWAPGDARLAWDRLPITLAFMALVSALLGEYVERRLGARLLLPLVLLGAASVAYWRYSGDLRLYVWIQGFALLAVPAFHVLYRPVHTHRWLLLAALGWYVLAKIAEVHDRGALDLTAGAISGHSLKHLLAAAGCLTIAWMIRSRRRLQALGAATPAPAG